MNDIIPYIIEPNACDQTIKDFVYNLLPIKLPSLNIDYIHRVNDMHVIISNGIPTKFCSIPTRTTTMYPSNITKYPNQATLIIVYAFNFCLLALC